MKTPVEIVCTHCGAEAFLKREPVYDGFKKTGDVLSCSACGGGFASEERVPFKALAVDPTLFTEADRTQAVKIFDEGENLRFCRYCLNYVVNPFMQFCFRNKKEVQATDSCPAFVPAGEKASDPLRRL
jgi:hypothetical protein